MDFIEKNVLLDVLERQLFSQSRVKFLLTWRLFVSIQVGPESVGASEGFLGWIAYLGAANAGVPLSIIVKNYGWNTYFGALMAACGCAVILLLPMVNLKSYLQQTESLYGLKVRRKTHVRIPVPYIRKAILVQKFVTLIL